MNVPEEEVGFPGGSDDKESVCNAGDLNLISGLGRYLGKWNGYPLQPSFLENFMDRRASGLKESGISKQLTHKSKR